MEKNAEKTAEQLERQAVDEVVRKITEQAEALVEINPIYDGERYKDDIFVRVNNKTYQIKRGEVVKVPKCVAEILENSQKQDILARRKVLEFVETIPQ